MILEHDSAIRRFRLVPSCSSGTQPAADRAILNATFGLGSAARGENTEMSYVPAPSKDYPAAQRRLIDKSLAAIEASLQLLQTIDPWPDFHTRVRRPQVSQRPE